MDFQNIGRLLPEWLNSNQHRSYPLDDLANGNGLPTSFLVDALFIASDNVDATKLYISSVTVSGDNVRINLKGYITSGDNNDSTEEDFGVVATVPFSTAPGTSVAFDLTTTTYTLVGNFVIGNVKSMEDVVGPLVLTETQGRIFPGCVRTVSDLLFGIQVNNAIYTGVVTLEAGDGIEFNVDTSDTGNVIIKMSCSNYTPPDGNLIIVDDYTLLNNAIAKFGYPIRTICGVNPDAEGNIIFATPEKGEGEEVTKYMTAEGVGDGAVYLAIANDDTKYECLDKSAQIDSLSQNLSKLNERATELDEVLTAIELANSNLAQQIARS